MKKTILLTFVLIFVLSLTACGTVGDVVSDAQSMGNSVIDGTQSVVDGAIDKTESMVDDAEEKAMNLMAGITANDAKKAALKHAGLDENQVTDVDIDLDRDNGKLIYEVDFNSGNTEYDYDIDAETGEVISADKSKD